MSVSVFLPTSYPYRCISEMYPLLRVNYARNKKKSLASFEVTRLEQPHGGALVQSSCGAQPSSHPCRGPRHTSGAISDPPDQPSAS